jgi:hypothetical protein
LSCSAATRIPYPVGAIASFGGGASSPSPVGWWKLNDASGTSAADSSGNSFTGTLNGAVKPTWGTGPNSNGDIVFLAANTDQYVDCTSTSTLKATTGTYSCWFKYVAAVTSFQCLLGNGNESSDRNGINLFISSSSHVAAEVCSASASSVATGTTTLSAGNWYHVVCTFDGSTLHLYLNGAEDTSGGTGTGYSLTPTPAYNFQFGSDGAHDAGTFFRSEMDDVRVYSSVLTSGQVSTLYSGGAQ